MGHVCRRRVMWGMTSPLFSACAQGGWQVLVLRYIIMAGPGQGWDGSNLPLNSPMPYVQHPGAVKSVCPHACSGLTDAGPYP